MRAITAEGPYGADVSFQDGLNVIWADNTKGKSTCMQAMLYALGLEKMLSPRREIPLPHAMTSYLRRDDGRQLQVYKSWVSLEIENGAGGVVTVRRPVKDEIVDNRLITVWVAAMLTDPSARAGERRYFVRDGGAFQREDGFLYFLEHFVGWDMPIVRKYDGPEGKLPLETVFPLFWVEQKAGWSTIPAAIPTYMRIREVHKRAVEFILNLDVHKLELERQRLKEAFEINRRDWAVAVDDMIRIARRGGGELDGLPAEPVDEVEAVDRWLLNFIVGGNRLEASQLLDALRAQVARLTLEPIPTVSANADALMVRLSALNGELDNANRRRIETHMAHQINAADVQSLKNKIAMLKDDLVKNQDVQRLQRFAGGADMLTPDRCPTCEQSLVDALISQNVLQAVMPIEDNIEYIRSQIKMFEDILRRELVAQRRLDALSAATTTEVNEIYARIRAVRADLTSASNVPSAVVVEERVRTEARIRDIENVVASLGEEAARLSALVNEFSELQKALASLPREHMTSGDREKLVALTDSVQHLARLFGFSTFPTSELAIDEDSYRPQKEGYEIGFETSASDAIRLKWAYQLALLEMAQHHDTNHPGLLLLDEPRQQSSSKVSFGALLERTATRQRQNQQIIISTSEDMQTLKPILSKLNCKKFVFPGYILQPVGTISAA